MNEQPMVGSAQDYVQQNLDRAKKSAVQKFLTKEARERLFAVKTVHPDLAEKVELAILGAVQAGNLKTEITEEQLKEILEGMKPKQQGFRILR